MSSNDVARIAGHLLRRLEVVRFWMLPIVLGLLVLMVAVAVPLTAVASLLVLLHRLFVSAYNFKPRRGVA
jgi:hypothetical protein